MESKPATGPVTLFLIGLNEGLARALERYLATDPRVVMLGAAPGFDAAAAPLALARPDLVLFDWAALKGSGREMIAALRAQRPEVRIACLVSERGAYATAAAQAGAHAAIAADRISNELEAALRDFIFPERFAAGGRAQ